MRAGWMRPSAISLSMAFFAISRRYGSKPDRMIAPGVSSTMRSTPVASSSARMLRPSRPMMRPFEIVARQIDHRDRGLDGVLGGAALNGFGDVLLGAVAGRFARLGVEPLEQVGGVVPGVAFDLLEQQLLGFVGRQAGDALELVLLLRDELLDTSSPRRPPAARGRRPRFARLQVLSSALDRGLALGELRFAPRERLFERCACCRSWRAWRSASVRISCAFSLASSRVSFRRVSASRSASLMMRSGLFFGAADRFGGDALAVGDPDGEHGAGRGQSATTAQIRYSTIRQHAWNVLSRVHGAPRTTSDV